MQYMMSVSSAMSGLLVSLVPALTSSVARQVENELVVDGWTSSSFLLCLFTTAKEETRMFFVCPENVTVVGCQVEGGGATLSPRTASRLRSMCKGYFALRKRVLAMRESNYRTADRLFAHASPRKPSHRPPGGARHHRPSYQAGSPTTARLARVAGLGGSESGSSEVSDSDVLPRSALQRSQWRDELRVRALELRASVGRCESVAACAVVAFFLAITRRCFLVVFLSFFIKMFRFARLVQAEATAIAELRETIAALLEQYDAKEDAKRQV